jgi:hypothetical protein
MGNSLYRVIRGRVISSGTITAIFLVIETFVRVAGELHDR